MSDKVVWASGARGSFVRTIDGGATCTAGVVPGAGELDFRDVQAFDDRTAFLLAIGEGEKSRIYQTADGGALWTLRFQNRDPKVFLDAFAFWDAAHGIALGDPVDGRFTIVTTEDGGLSWHKPAGIQMPPALAGEGAFAASGTCLVVHGDGNAWFGTGGAEVARVFRSTDGGRSWTVHPTPILAGNASSGIFSVAVRTSRDGIAVGGDYKNPERDQRLFAITADGGLTWTCPEGAALGGYRSAVAFGGTSTKPVLIAVGPTGSDRSLDAGTRWTRLGKTGFHAVGCAGASGWFAAGEDGTLARLNRTVD